MSEDLGIGCFPPFEHPNPLVPPVTESPRVEWTQELERLALRALLEEYEQLNYALFSDKLRLPTLTFCDGGGRLGQWQAEPPTISISRQLVISQPWGSVAEVLKHEMAHQFVTEVLGVAEPKAHGPLFRKVCEDRGIDARAAGVQSPPTGASDSVVHKVVHLLALAQSDQRHEAEAAAAAAQRLMLKHNVSELSKLERKDYCYAHLGKPSGRVDESQRSLAAVLRDFFFVETLWVGVYRALEGRRGSVLEVCGTHANVEMAQYVHSFLNSSAERLWLAHKKQHRIGGNRDRRKFVAGVMAGFHAKLKAQRVEHQQQGLVWLGDEELTRYFRRRFPRVRTVRYATSSRTDAHAAGQRAGRELVLSKGVGAGSSGKRRLLPGRRG